MALAGHCVEIAEGFTHASVFGAEHTLHMLIAERLGVEIDPGGHPLDDVESLFVAAVHVHVEQSSHHFVDGVERCPDLLAFAQAVKELNRKGAQIAALQRSLALAKAGDDSAGVLPEVFVRSRGIHQSTGGEVVPPRIVAAQFAIGLLPAAERLSRGGQSRCQAECVQQTIGRKRVKVSPIGFHRQLAGAVSEAHLLERKRQEFPTDPLAAYRVSVLLNSVYDRILQCARQKRWWDKR